MMEKEDEKEFRENRIKDMLELAKDYKEANTSEYPMASNNLITAQNIVKAGIHFNDWMLLTVDRSEEGTLQIHPEDLLNIFGEMLGEITLLVCGEINDKEYREMLLNPAELSNTPYASGFGKDLHITINNTTAALFSAVGHLDTPLDEDDKIYYTELMVVSITVLLSIIYDAIKSHKVQDAIMFENVEEYMFSKLLELQDPVDGSGSFGVTKMIDTFNGRQSILFTMPDKGVINIQIGSVTKKFKVEHTITATSLVVFNYLEDRVGLSNANIKSDVDTISSLEGFSMKFISGEFLSDEFTQGCTPVLVPNDVESMDEFLDYI